MTKELLNEIENDYWNEKADPIDMTEVFDLANRALEQQPSEDCISRAEAIKIFGEVHPLDYNKQSYIANIQKLPSVTPSYNSVKTELKPCKEENLNCTECRYYNHEKHHCPRFCRVIKDTMAEITSEQTRWIPCSERLPEREGWYLTSLGDKTYGGADVDMYCKGWVKYGTHVLAWMPLPESYKAESEDKNDK